MQLGMALGRHKIITRRVPRLFEYIDEIVENLPFDSFYEVVDVYPEKKTVRFAYSELEFENKIYAAWREFSRNYAKPWNHTKIFADEKSTKKPNQILNGEDPRLFRFAGKPYVYYQIFDELRSDCRIFIQNLETKIKYELSSPLGFSGKNWVPFVFKGELKFIYSLEPLVILNAKFNESQVILEIENSPFDFSPRWDVDFKNSIGKIRGGSPGIEFENKIIGFTHEVQEGDHYTDHTLGIFAFDPSSMVLKTAPLSKHSKNLLIDPYGFQISDDGDIDIFCSIVQNPIHLSTSSIANVKIRTTQASLSKFLGNA